MEKEDRVENIAIVQSVAPSKEALWICWPGDAGNFSSSYSLFPEVYRIFQKSQAPILISPSSFHDLNLICTSCLQTSASPSDLTWEQVIVSTDPISCQLLLESSSFPIILLFACHMNSLIRIHCHVLWADGKARPHTGDVFRSDLGRFHPPPLQHGGPFHK